MARGPDGGKVPMLVGDLQGLNFSLVPKFHVHFVSGLSKRGAQGWKRKVKFKKMSVAKYQKRNGPFITELLWQNFLCKLQILDGYQINALYTLGLCLLCFCLFWWNSRKMLILHGTILDVRDDVII